MPVVVTTVDKRHFEQYNMYFPESWEVRHVDWTISDDSLIEACKGADFLFVFPTQRVSRYVIENSPSLRYIQCEGVAFDKIDLQAADECEIPVCNNKGANALSVAEFTVGMMITMQRRLLPTDREIKAGNFLQCQTAYRARGVKELRSAHVGIIGLGDIGRNVARMLKPFNCRKISYTDIVHPGEAVEKELNVSALSFEELIKHCDIITMHVPVTPETINMISDKEIEMMRPDAMIINTARGEVLDQHAVARALEAGRIYGAGTDVLSPEPPPADHPLLNLSPAAADRMYITPHVAGTTDESFEEMIRRSIINMQNVLDGKPLNCVVNNIINPRNT